MQCDNHFCVYWAEQHCTLGEISLDIQGSCANCIYVDIEQEVLWQAREQMLQRFEK